MRKISRFGRFAANTTFPGIKYAHQAESTFGKVFWTIASFLGLSVGIFVCYGVLESFSQSPSYTIITQQPTVPLKFPSITFCLLFRTTNKKLAALNITDTNDVDYLFHSFFTFTSPGYFDIKRSKDIIDKVKNSNSSQVKKLLKTHSVVELIKDLTPKCAELSFLCAIGPNGRPENCCDYVHQVNLASNGPCYTFDVLTNYSQSVRSTMGKAMVFITMPPESELPKSTFYSYGSTGISIFPTKEAASVEDNPTMVDRGTGSVVVITVVRRSRLCSPINRCVNREGSHERCFFDCVTAKVLGWCGCVGLNSFIEQNTINICSAEQAYICQAQSENVSLADAQAGLWGKCYDECPMACQADQYEIRSSSMRSSRPESKNIIENQNFGTTGDRVAMWIYYPDLVITLITEKPQFTWQTLLSNIGGIFGLWIGAILMGVVHIFYSLIVAVWETCVAKKTQIVENCENSK